MDNTNGRYQGTNGQGRTFSRSWLIHGEAEAGRLLLEAMWSAALRSTGLSTAHCPVKGIFRVGGVRASSASTASSAAHAAGAGDD